LLVSVLALFVFGGGILTLDNIVNPGFNFTIANTLFVIAVTLQALFCFSLNKAVLKSTLIAFCISTIVFVIAFEFLRVNGTFEIRTVLVATFYCLFYVWQIFELNTTRKRAPSSQLAYLQYATYGELIFAIGRVAILVASTFTITEVNQIPQMLILFTIAQLVMNTLSYIAIGGFWAEQIAKANVQSKLENQEIKALLAERESLISSLLRANKTASTGALSASIAHELNQPLGASSLNIQFLQKKLAEGEVNPVIEKEILDTLLSDNQRAANIIRSLRSIFSEEKVVATKVDVGELLHTVLNIAKAEITAQKIQITLQLESGLIANVTAGEIQQVLLNLINNAIQVLAASSRSDRALSIEGRHVDDSIQISIADNGDGVSAEVQEHLFELLSSTKKSGMGLGLWLCKHIITRHGGTIWFESLPQGGAKFVFKLPTEPNFTA
jgi:signal transduction histidine kinase